MYVAGRKTTGSGPKQSVDGKVKAGVTYKYSAKVKYDFWSCYLDNLTLPFEMKIRLI
ncbi:carbohydrate binding domain-containing protein [Paenibacillus hexagrammi]|uniref:hypothetical protein n=1 Tax=Paenibacillus hexagrammi TaxID=2908839 RepID=UPI003312F919